MFVERVCVAELEVFQGTSAKTVYLQTTLLDDGLSGLRLVVTDGEDVWKGQVSEDDLNKLAIRLKMEFKKFVSQSVSALTRESLGDISFEYHLKALPSDRMQLVWKKCVASDDIKFQLGHVNLEREDSPSHSLGNVLSQCVAAITALRKQIGDLEGDNERLARDRNSAIKRLDKCVAAKAEVESDLFSKFVAILNSKKDKIRELEEERHNEVVGRVISPVPGPSRDDDGISSKPSNSNSRKRNGQPASSVKESTPHTMDTDEEAEEAPAKQMRLSANKQVTNLDSSINWGEEEEDTSAAPVARRARRKAPSKKPTISKPVLPKVTSSPLTIDRPSSVRKSSLRKSGSGSSKGSVNTEDLLDQI